jgi:hypothetical protein
MKIWVFWNVKPCSVVRICRLFRIAPHITWSEILNQSRKFMDNDCSYSKKYCYGFLKNYHHLSPREVQSRAGQSPILWLLGAAVSLLKARFCVGRPQEGASAQFKPQRVRTETSWRLRQVRSSGEPTKTRPVRSNTVIPHTWLIFPSLLLFLLIRQPIMLLNTVLIHTPN